MPIAEITQAGTAERARLLRAVSYEVALDLTRGGEVFGSTSVIRFGCTRSPSTARGSIRPWHARAGASCWPAWQAATS